MRGVVLAAWLWPLAVLAGGFSWDVPEPIEATAVPGAVDAMGIPVTLRAAVSRMHLDEIEDYYLRAFVKGGLYVPPAKDQVRMSRYPQLTAIDPETKLAYTVILQPNKDGSTTVLMATSDVSNYPNAVAPDDFAPLFPGAEHVSRVHDEGHESILFTSNRAPKEIEDYYQKTLATDGYQPKKDGLLVGPKGWVRVATHQKKGELWVLVTHGTSAIAH